MLKSNIETVTARQLSYKLDTARLKRSPDNLNYWLGHLLEEITEFALAKPEDKVDEAVDIVIFLQNYAAVLLPKTTLRINTLSSKLRFVSVPELILALRKTNIYRKDWKSYSVELDQIQLAFQLTLLYISWFVDMEDVEKAFMTKESYNTTRTDWTRN